MKYLATLALIVDNVHVFCYFVCVNNRFCIKIIAVILSFKILELETVIIPYTAYIFGDQIPKINGS